MSGGSDLGADGAKENFAAASPDQQADSQTAVKSPKRGVTASQALSNAQIEYVPLPVDLLLDASPIAAAVSAASALRSSGATEGLAPRQRGIANAAAADAITAAVLAAADLREGVAPDPELLARADPKTLVDEVRRKFKRPLTPAGAGAGAPATVDGQSETVEGQPDNSESDDPLPAAIPYGQRTGRPATYSSDEARSICDWIASGRSLATWCDAHGRRPSTIYAWARQVPEFASRLQRAYEDRADALVDEMLAIADDPGASDDLAKVQAAKLRVETRKWIASRLRPARWGDVSAAHNGASRVLINIQTGRQQQPVDCSPAPGDVID